MSVKTVFSLHFNVISLKITPFVSFFIASKIKLHSFIDPFCTYWRHSQSQGETKCTTLDHTPESCIRWNGVYMIHRCLTLSIIKILRWNWNHAELMKFNAQRPHCMLLLLDRKKLIHIVGPWMCIKQNIYVSHFKFLSYTCSTANDRYEVFPAQRWCGVYVSNNAPAGNHCKTACYVTFWLDR